MTHYIHQLIWNWEENHIHVNIYILCSTCSNQSSLKLPSSKYSHNGFYTCYMYLIVTIFICKSKKKKNRVGFNFKTCLRKYNFYENTKEVGGALFSYAWFWDCIHFMKSYSNSSGRMYDNLNNYTVLQTEPIYWI